MKSTTRPAESDSGDQDSQPHDVIGRWTDKRDGSRQWQKGGGGGGARRGGGGGV